MGIIRECGGKMHMAERQWAEAATDFFEAFKNYDEAGNHRRIQCLKYVYVFSIKINLFLRTFCNLCGAIFLRHPLTTCSCNIGGVVPNKIPNRLYKLC